MSSIPVAAARAVAEHVIQNPLAVVRAARRVIGLELPIPLSAVRWIANRMGGSKAPKDLEIRPSPPGLRFSATLELMRTPVRASAVVYIEDVHLDDEEMRIELRLSDVALDLAGESETPVATLLKSGALDLSKPGNFVKVMPRRPAVIVEARDDRVVLDLMNVPRLGKSDRVRQILGVVTPALGVRSIRTNEDDLVVALRASPLGFLGSAAALGALWRSRRGYR